MKTESQSEYMNAGKDAMLKRISDIMKRDLTEMEISQFRLAYAAGADRAGGWIQPRLSALEIGLITANEKLEKLEMEKVAPIIKFPFSRN